MKIIINKSLILTNHSLAQQAVNSISLACGKTPPTIDNPLDTINEAVNVTMSRKHFQITQDDTAVTYEISDEVVVTITKIYCKIAGMLSTLFTFARPMFRELGDDFKGVTGMLEETL